VLPGTGYDGVVALTAPNGGLCTGTLLSSGRHILTAAHCVTDDNGALVTGNYTVTFELPGPQIQQITVPSAAISVYPGYNPKGSDVNDFANDLAVLQLPVPAPAGVQGFGLYTQNNDVGQRFTLVGYGQTGWGAVGKTCGGLCESGTKRTGENVFTTLADILATPPLSAKPNPPNGTALAVDFNDGNPAHDAFGVYYGLPGSGLLNDEAFIASGDSGGPGFINNQIAGVASYLTTGGPPVDVLPGINSSFGEIGVYMRVSAFADWITGVVSTQNLRVTAPATTTSGAPFNVTVTALDAAGNVVPAYRGTVHFTSSDPEATLPANYTFTAADAGTHVFTVPAGVTLVTGGSQTISVTDTVNPPLVHGSAVVAVNPASLLVQPSRPNVASGLAFSVTVTALDSAGQVFPNYRGRIHFTSTDAAAGVVLPPDYTFTPADQGIHTFGLGVTLQTTGPRTISVADTATGNPDGSAAVTVVGALDGLLVLPAVNTVASGAPFGVTVGAVLPNGRIDTGYTGTVHFTSSDAGAGVMLPANYTFVAADQGVHLFTVGNFALVTPGDQTVTATDTAVPAINGRSQPILVTGRRLTVTTSVSRVTPGTAFTVTVSALNAAGNVDPTYTGTVHFSSTDGGAITLPADYTFMAADNGVHQFNGVILQTPGVQTVTATDTVTATITGTARVTVVGPATRFQVLTNLNPATDSVNTGTPFSVTVVALDADGNVAIGYTGTVHFTSNDGAAALPADYTFVAADSGSHTFNNGVTLNTAGSRTVTAQDTGVPGINGTATVTVIGAVARLLVIPAGPVGAGLPFSVTVRAVDGNGNDVAGYTGTIRFTTSDMDSGVVLPPNYTFVAGDAGQHTFVNAVTLVTLGQQTLTATDTGNGTITGVALVGVAGPAQFLRVSGPLAPQMSGAGFAITVTAFDAAGLPTPSYTGTIQFTSTDGAAVLPANYTFVAGDRGSRTFNGVMLSTVGVQTITARDTANATLAGSAGVTVVPAALVVAGFPSPIPAGMPGTFTVTAYDASGNVATGYTGTVHFTSSDPQAMLPANMTLTNGTGTFSATLKTAGTQSITATDTVTMTLTGTQSGITVTANAATSTMLTSSRNPAAPGQPVTLTATVSTTAQGAGTPVGNVIFFDGTNPLGTVALTNGVATLTTSTLSPGRHTLTATYTGGIQGGVTFAPSLSAALTQTVAFRYFAVGGAPGLVQVRRDSDGSLVTEFAPYGSGYTGAVTVAVGDVSGDGIPDLVTGAGTGNPDVRVFDGLAIEDGTFSPADPGASLLAQWFAYGLNFNVGVNVAVGDVEKDGFADVVTGASAGNPQVKVYNGKDIATHTFNPNGSSVVAQWFAYGLEFNIGAYVAVGDVNGDGYADVVTGASAGNPHVKVYNGKDIALGQFHADGSSLLAQWFPYQLQFNVGAFVAVGDTNGDGFGEVITGATVGNPDVRVYDGKAIANGTFNPDGASQLTQFFAYDLASNVGAAVAAADFESTGQADILTGASSGSPHYPVVRGNATGTLPPALFEGIPTDLQGGISVGA
jgi:hypothetical protein